MVELGGLLICVPLWTIAVLLLGASITASLFVFHVAVVPLIFKYSKTFRRGLIFANFVQWPLYIEHDDPASCGVEGGRNLSIEYHSKVDNCRIKIGIWHILPKSVYERLKGSFEGNVDKEELNRVLDEELANTKTPIMMYCHGNSNSRGATHRIHLYRFFQRMDFHTIAFDYRGYGDSTNVSPSEDGVVEDSLVVYEWLLNTVSKEQNTDRPAVFVWGHSLGTGISSHLLGNLQELSASLLDRDTALPLPNGLVLEAPFNNLADEVYHHPLSKLVTWLPYYDATFVAPFRTAPEHTFRSDRHLARQKALPVLILHAKDDVVVPFVVGLKLYRSIAASRSLSDAPVTLHAYARSHNLGHKWICDAEDLPDVVGGKQGLKIKGISSHLLGNLQELSASLLDRDTALPLPNGLVLEAPFNNLADEVYHHPLSKLVTWLPYYDATFVAPFRTAPEHTFRSDRHLARQKALPVLILHAKDDVVVPFVVGLKLYRSIAASRSLSDAPVTLHAYARSHNLGHKWICDAEDLPDVVGEFVKKHQRKL